jgi:hypothetical protein
MQTMTGSLWRSAFVAAVFALHPLRVESVAWASERKDVLGAVFWMLAMLAYATYARRPGAGHYLLLVLCVAIGLLAKPMLVTLPFVLLLVDIWPLRRASLSVDFREDASGAGAAMAHQAPLASSRQNPTATDSAAPRAPVLASSREQWHRAILEKVPLLLLVLASSIVTIWAQHRGGAVISTQRVPIDLRVENAIVSYVRYLGMLFWPGKLAVFYPLPREIETAQVLASAALLVVITALAIRWRTRRPYFLVGWLWYLGTLVPVIGLVQVGEQALADRYTYIPLIGVTLIVAWVAEDLTRPIGAIRKPLLAIVSLGLCVAMAWRTWVQIGCWRDTFTLFDHALAVTADNYRAHDYVGTELARAGDRRDAIGHFRQAIAIKPDYAEAHFNLANALRDSGDVRGAIDQYQQAVALRPSFAQAWNNLGALWAGLGDWTRAAAAFGQAVESLPDWPDAHANLARALEALGKPEAAQEQYQRALALDPHSDAARRGIERLHNSSPQPGRDR